MTSQKQEYKSKSHYYTEGKVIYIDSYNNSATVSYEDNNGKEHSLELKIKKPGFAITDIFKLEDKVSVEIVGYDVFLHFKGYRLVKG